MSPYGTAEPALSAENRPADSPAAYNAGQQGGIVRLRWMRQVALAGVVFAGIVSTGSRPEAQTQSEPQRATSPGPSSATRTTWYFYTVKWGYQDEFLDLFQKNHYPLLKAQRDAGRFVSVRTFVPTYHGDGRADWTFAVELVRREQAPEVPTEDELVRKLYPDQETFKKEERRRFELLEAHWDVPLDTLDLDTRKMGGR
jgi:hypothetical protein